MASETLSILIEAIEEASGRIGKIEESLDRLNKTTEKASLSNMLQQSGKTMQDVGDRMTRNVTTPIVNGLGYAVQSAIDFDAAMGDLNKVTGFERNSEEANKMADTLKELSKEMPITAVGLAEIATAGAQLGIPAAELENFTNIVAKNSVAFDMLPAQAGESFAKLSNIFGQTTKETETLFDAINHLSNNSAATAAQIIDATTRAGPAASSFGLLDRETAALTATMIGFGYAPEVVGTALSGLLPNLQPASKGNEKFQLALEQMGLTFKGL
jgi:TP901 family phage tail tape measure protein